eukprot:TRINITY_DN17549_c0_g1_i2.p1 TRINITY_DN17549_c0_g1~~TRINITY_DN17549_c0_g1_i2.p1  ORF type:complete len:283 (+),score=33.50 TRINITY_DN17549_c0_g1_i2:121-969(+)
MCIRDRMIPDIPSFQIYSFRATVNLVMCSWSCWKYHIPMYGSNRKEQDMLNVRGLLGFSGAACFFYVATTLPMSDGVTLMRMTGLWNCLLAPLLIKETFKKLNLIAGLACFGGIIFIVRPYFIFQYFPSLINERDLGKYDPNWRLFNLSIAILASVLFSFALITIRWLGKSHHACTINTYWCFFGTLFGPVGMVWQGVKLPTWYEASILVLIAIVGQGGNIMSTRAYQFDKAARLGVLSYLEIVFAFILEIILIGRNPPLCTYFGAALTIITSALVILSRDK